MNLHLILQLIKLVVCHTDVGPMPKLFYVSTLFLSVAATRKRQQIDVSARTNADFLNSTCAEMNFI